MGRTRREVDRTQKVQEILDAAERQLMQGGYGALSVIGVARELGVAQNAIYWYFPNKDELFVAVLRRLLERLAIRKPPPSTDLAARVVWVVDRFAEFEVLGAAVTERARTSGPVRALERELEELKRSMAEAAVRELGVPAGEVNDAGDAVLATVNGLLASRVASDDRHRVIAYLLEQLGKSGMQLS